MPRNQWDDIPQPPEPELTLSGVNNDLQQHRKSSRTTFLVMGVFLAIACIFICTLLVHVGSLGKMIEQQSATMDALKGKAEQAATSPVTAVAMADTASISELRNKLTEYHALAEQTAADLDKYQREWNSIYLNGK